MIENKKILILGMAKSGYEVAKLLSTGNNQIYITDQKDQEEEKIQELAKMNIPFIKTLEPENILDNTFDILIKNPAVFPFHPCVEKARELKIPIVNEMEVAYHYIKNPVKIIGITGSNGKTTTTTLIYEVLKKAGKSVKLGGNIGTPLSQIVSSLEPNDINVKRKIFNHHTKKDIAIINATNYDSMKLTENILSTKYYFNNKENYILEDHIYIDNKPVMNTKDIIIKGTHNYENILVTYLLAKVLDIDFLYVNEVLKEFKGVEHRIEFVRELNGVKYYNDSKSTNPTATITALKSFDGNIHLILGGMERSQDFQDLVPYLSKVTCIYAIGEVRKRIMDFAHQNKVKAYEFNTLKEAMTKIKEEVKPRDIVLLSPASASWDQYLKFEDRGNEFKSIVNSLERV